MVLGNLPVPGRPTYSDSSAARAYCACGGCSRGLFGHFFSHLSLLFSFSLSLGDGPIYIEILSQRAVKPKTTNQPTDHIFTYDILKVLSAEQPYLSTINEDKLPQLDTEYFFSYINILTVLVFLFLVQIYSNCHRQQKSNEIERNKRRKAETNTSNNTKSSFCTRKE